MLTRYGIEYKRATMCNQMIGLSRALQPMLEMMWEDMLSREVIRMDETRLQVIDEPGRKAEQISWMHVAVGEYERKKIILFHYHTSRSGDVPKKILEGWKGYITKPENNPVLSMSDAGGIREESLLMHGAGRKHRWVVLRTKHSRR
jgi:transposase